MTRLKQIQPNDLDVSGLSMTPEEVAHESSDDSIRVREDGIIVEIRTDYSVKLTIPENLHPGGLTIVLRDPNQTDLEFVATHLKNDPSRMPEVTKRLVCRICTQWGDRDGVTIPVYEKIRSKLAKALMEEVGGFL